MYAKISINELKKLFDWTGASCWDENSGDVYTITVVRGNEISKINFVWCEGVYRLSSFENYSRGIKIKKES